MKDLFKLLAAAVVTGVGMNFGFKLWDEVLEDKVDSLKDRLTQNK